MSNGSFKVHGQTRYISEMTPNIFDREGREPIEIKIKILTADFPRIDGFRIDQ